MKPPPLPVVFIAVLMLALGVTAGAAMSQLRAETEQYARERIEATRAVHGLIGAAEYDDVVIRRTVFAAEAGLSFLHTHAMGLPAIVLLATTIVATAIPWRAVRGLLYVLLGGGALFPLGYLVYAAAVLELGQDAGIALAETWLLTPLGSAAIAGLVGLAAALARAAGAPRSA